MQFRNITILLLLLNSIVASAQYKGGNGDGYAVASNSTFLDGTELSQIYSGGFDDGFSFNSTAAFLNGTSLSTFYGGGFSDGFSNDGNATFLDGSLLATIFSGGNDDGFSSYANASFLDGSLLSQLFSGGVSDGFNFSNSSSFLDGTTLASLYSGGNADGFSENTNSQFLNGTNLAVFTSGGAGDGFSEDGAFLVSTDLAYALWIGITSTNWHTGSNWYSGDVPTTTDVQIDGAPVNQPIISNNVATLDLGIQTGAIVKVEAGKALSVTGTLTIADAEGLILKSSSSSTGYAQLLVTGTQNGAGTIKGEFYVGNNDGFRHVSSPFVTDFNDIKIGGNLLVAANTPQGNLYQWDAASANWQAPALVTNNFGLGEGYAVFMGTNSYGSYVSPLPAILNLSGPLQSTADVSVALDYNTGLSSAFFPVSTLQVQTEGWNLVGNPYPSAYDWDGQTFPTEMTNEGIAVWNPSTGQYAYYNNGTSINGGSRYIAPYQGVFIQTTAATTFTFGKNNRTVSQSPALLKTIDEQIVLSVKSQENPLISDETILAFKPEASDEFEGDKDMWKFLNNENSPSFYSIENGQSFAINKLASFNESRSVTLGFKTNVNGNYSIDVNLDDFDPSYFVELEDVLLRKIYDLRKGEYHFTHTSSNKTERFIVHINKKGNQIENPEKRVFISSSNNEIVIDFSQSLFGAKKIKVYDLIGRELVSIKVEMNKERVVIPMNGRKNPYYVVQIISSYWSLTEKVFLIK